MSSLRFSRIALVQGLTVFAIVLVLSGFCFFVWTQHERVQKKLTDLEPRYARLLGIAAKRSALQTAGQVANDQLSSLVYPLNQDVTQAGNDAQQRIRALFADSKLDIISIQVLPAKEEGVFDRITIDLRVEGELTGIQNALTLLAGQTPTVVTNELSLQTIGAVKPASIQRLAGQFSFSVFRRRL